ncbi:MAG TPA: hypothetical protein VLC12_03290, partial [Terriglobales bacterium]|nr:hypothetical protein [Terriglobales bacterium]
CFAGEHLNRPCGTSNAQSSMNCDKTIAEIEWLERLYSLPDDRPQQLSDLYAVNQRHDEKYANNPWFRLWQRYGV